MQGALLTKPLEDWDLEDCTLRLNVSIFYFSELIFRYGNCSREETIQNYMRKYYFYLACNKFLPATIFCIPGQRQASVNS